MTEYHYDVSDWRMHRGPGIVINRWLAVGLAISGALNGLVIVLRIVGA